jgi:hypoxanthine phosphoribosyltransferase
VNVPIAEVLVTAAELSARVGALAAEISRDYAGKEIVLVGVLKGAVFFMAVSSYGSSTKSSGVVRILKDLDETIEGRNVLVCEDILDTGLTLKYLLKNLASRKPASLEVVALLSKDGKQRVPISCKYVGYVCPDEFVVGYGLDYAERYRNLPYIGVLRPAAYMD